MCLKIAELISVNYRQIDPFKSENEDAPPEFETWNLKHGGPKDDTTLVGFHYQRKLGSNLPSYG